MAAPSFGAIGYAIEAGAGDLSALFDTGALGIKLGCENSYVVVTGVEGGSEYGQS